jgi:hypothetical protein
MTGGVSISAWPITLAGLYSTVNNLRYGLHKNVPRSSQRAAAGGMVEALVKAKAEDLYSIGRYKNLD